LTIDDETQPETREARAAAFAPQSTALYLAAAKQPL